MCVRFIDFKKIKHCLSKRRERGKKKHTKKRVGLFLKKAFFKMMLNKFMLKKIKLSNINIYEQEI